MSCTRLEDTSNPKPNTVKALPKGIYQTFYVFYIDCFASYLDRSVSDGKFLGFYWSLHQFYLLIGKQLFT